MGESKPAGSKSARTCKGYHRALECIPGCVGDELYDALGFFKEDPLREKCQLEDNDTIVLLSVELPRIRDAGLVTGIRNTRVVVLLAVVPRLVEPRTLAKNVFPGSLMTLKFFNSSAILFLAASSLSIEMEKNRIENEIFPIRSASRSIRA
ncbi:hypothetical protein N9S30_00055 [bacterium]|nr:hypothetical protein [bacterium]